MKQISAIKMESQRRLLSAFACKKATVKRKKDAKISKINKEEATCCLARLQDSIKIFKTGPTPSKDSKLRTIY